MQSNLNSKPSWLSYYPTDNKNVEDSDYGFDGTGMWFSGNAGGCGGVSFPIRYNQDISSEATTTVTFTMNQEACSDQGICFFNTATEPSWEFGSCENRIAIMMNCNGVQIGGRFTDYNGVNLGEGSTYTFRVTYTPSSSTVRTEVFDGSNVSATKIYDNTLNDRLPAGPYRIGFDCDADGPASRGYFTYLQIGADETVNYPLPKYTFRVNNIDYSKILSNPLPDSLDNIILGLESATIFVPYVDRPLKHGDEFTLYGSKAIKCYESYIGKEPKVLELV
jgi:hypothetical protein